MTLQADLELRREAPGAARAGYSPLDLIGNTPVLHISHPFTQAGRGFWAKLEGCNPGGIKDRAARHMIQRARERGDLAPGGTIIESSSGTFGLGLALVGIGLGHPVIVVAEVGMEPLVQRLLVAYGVRIEVVTEPSPSGGWQAARIRRARELLAAIPGAFWPDQYDNPDNAGAYAVLAHELIAQLGPIDVVVCSVGTGGHSAGIARALRVSQPQVQLVGVDVVGSVIFGQTNRARVTRGLGNSVYPRNVDYAAFNEVHWVSAAEMVHVCRELARTGYVSGGWSVGAVALVGRWLARTRPSDGAIVAVFCDGPQRYWASIYDDDYCRDSELLGATPADDPDEIRYPWERDVERWTRCTVVVDPRQRDVQREHVE